MAARVGARLSCRNGEYYTASLCKILLFLFDDFGNKPIDFTGFSFGRMKEFGLQKLCRLCDDWTGWQGLLVGNLHFSRYTPRIWKMSLTWRRRSSGCKPGRKSANAGNEQ